MATKPREYKRQEILEKFIDHVWGIIKYWDGIPKMSTTERLEGVAFSILTTLDGCAGDQPGFIVAPDPHPEDKEFLQSEGENWYPEIDIEIPSDIGSWLHNTFVQRKPGRK